MRMRPMTDKNNKDIPSAFPGVPFLTSPFSFRSIYQLSVSPAWFFNTKAKTAFPFLTASARSEGEDCREALMASKAVEAGKLSKFYARELVQALTFPDVDTGKIGVLFESMG